MVIDLAFELIGLLNAYCAPHGFAVFKHDECGHRLYAVGHGQVAVFVDVDFNDVGFVAHALFHVFEDGGLCTAGATPCGEEVDQCGFVLIIRVLKSSIIILGLFVFTLVTTVMPFLLEQTLISRRV